MKELDLNITVNLNKNKLSKTFSYTGKWQLLGEGTYNEAYVSFEKIQIDGYECHWVLKIPKKKHSALSQTARAVRIWREINPEYPVYETETGWIVPYLGRIEANDKQTADKVIEIYRSKKRVVADACGIKNCLIVHNKTVCIDVDQAFRASSPTSRYFQSSLFYKSGHKLFLDSCRQEGFSKSAATIQAIHYLEEQIPTADILDVYLTPVFLNKLFILKQHNTVLSPDILNAILALVAVDPDNEVSDQHINPAFIKKLSTLVENKTAIAADIAALIHEQLCNPKQSQELSTEEFLQSSKWVIRHQRDLLNAAATSGYSLIHVVVIEQDLEALIYLRDEGADLNKVSAPPAALDAIIQYPLMTPLDIAFVSYDARLMVKILKDAAATHGPSMLIKECIDLSLPALLEQLLLLAKNTSNLSTAFKQRLLKLIQENPYILTWELDADGYSFLHYAFENCNIELINSIVQLPQWKHLSQTINNKNGWTLLHIITRYGHLSLYTYLSAVDHNAATHNSQSTALHIASKCNDDQFCLQLLASGANPSLKDSQAKEPIELWNDPLMSNPIGQFRENLALLASGKEPIPKRTKAKLLALIKEHRHFLTWPITKLGFNFVATAFMANNTEIIKLLLAQPDWETLAKTPTSKDTTLFDCIAAFGRLEHYDIIKKSFPGPWVLDRALHAAAKRGQAAFCRKLLADGANPDYRSTNGKNAEDCWQNHDPNIENPIPIYLRNKQLAHKKVAILQLLRTSLFNQIRPSHRFSSLNQELQKKIQAAAFTTENAEEAKASILLKKIIAETTKQHTLQHSQTNGLFALKKTAANKQSESSLSLSLNKLLVDKPSVWLAKPSKLR